MELTEQILNFHCLLLPEREEVHGRVLCAGVSMLERLMNIDLYKRHETYGYNNRFISKLLRNYRCEKDEVSLHQIKVVDLSSCNVTLNTLFDTSVHMPKLK